MTVTIGRGSPVDVSTGGLWLLTIDVLDGLGEPVDDEPTVTVTLPDDSTAAATVEADRTGRYRASYTVAAEGRYLARAATAANGLADIAAWAGTPVPDSGMPTADVALAYLAETSWTTDQVQGALDAEAAAQRAVCRVPAVFGADLREALLRRVARNLAMRNLPLAVLQGDAEAGSTTLPRMDPETRRLEAPYRPVVFG